MCLSKLYPTPLSFLCPPVLQSRVEAMVDELNSHKRAQRHPAAAAGGSEFINEKNRRYNAMLDKEIGKYSVDIKQSLERGTA